MHWRFLRQGRHLNIYFFLTFPTLQYFSEQPALQKKTARWKPRRHLFPSAAVWNTYNNQ